MKKKIKSSSTIVVRSLECLSLIKLITEKEKPEKKFRPNLGNKTLFFLFQPYFKV